ncbi:hypothetical protein ACFQS1_19925 [Paractinoplanes rhizophilus]|uniref:Uncharacterized protein n=1 Tax=Paractinoplanes rhizophilus TaxID=1416877 RepID=A0ABW2HVT2_9ACTN
MSNIDLSSYNTVADRMREFFETYPEGCLRPHAPWRVETIGDKAFVIFEAAAYRTACDQNPGVGTAWEPFPGRTPYTRDSELMNAETSAWGRAILAVGAADTRKGIASAEEVRNRHAERDAWEEAAPAPTTEQAENFTKLLALIQAATATEIPAIGKEVSALKSDGQITPYQYEQLARAASARLAKVQGGGS